MSSSNATSSIGSRLVIAERHVTDGNNGSKHQRTE
jgi:hypothetical protein